MAANDEEGPIEFVVVMNDEDQYSIWPRCRSVPAGWRSADIAGTKAECLECIERVWTDLRPLSLRRATAEQAK